MEGSRRPPMVCRPTSLLGPEASRDEMVLRALRNHGTRNTGDALTDVWRKPYRKKQRESAFVDCYCPGGLGPPAKGTPWIGGCRARFVGGPWGAWADDAEVCRWQASHRANRACLHNAWGGVGALPALG